MLYFGKKILYSLLVLLGGAMLLFIIFQSFGDPARMIVGQTGDKKTMENIRKELHLDQPKWKQLLLYLNDISPLAIHDKSEITKKELKGIFLGKGDRRIGIKLPYLGKSYQTKKPTLTVLSEALPGTIVLAVTAMIFACVIGIFLGVMAAVYKGTWIDNTAVFGSIAGISAPSFFMGIVIAYLFGYVLSDITGLHMTGSLFDTDPFTGRQLQLQNLILPAVTLGIRPMAIITQLTRSSMLDVLNQDYIRTAYAKGLSKRSVIWKHALRNALNPVITAITAPKTTNAKLICLL